MHHMSRSQYQLEILDQFIESDKSKIYLDLYPREVTSLESRYCNQLNFTVLKRVFAYKNDRRYHCLVEKKVN